MAQKPSIPKGTRDFSPQEMAKRNYIFDTIKSVFLLYGFQPIETPAMENLSTLMGKYGEEGDKLLFKILNSGDYLKNAPDELLANKDYIHLITKLSEKGLRYDLTVPFARYVVQHRNDLQMPFKRYQIQPVWRADRPQRGRYREFYQCDADVAEKIVDITVAIDKMDKIGLDNVNAELAEKGLSQQAIDTLRPLLTLSGTNQEKIATLEQLLATSQVGLKGIEEIKFVLDTASSLNLTAKLELDVSLARGLNYYTGTILEVKALDVEMGSICGGGRYDNLTGVFGMDGLSGVGFSFGADRIFDVLNTLNLYPAETSATTRVIFMNFGHNEAVASLRHMRSLRHAGISCELYPESTKMKKQMNYANSKGIPFVAMVGESEMQSNTIAIKNMGTGEQNNYTIEQAIELLK